jgi:glycosyltransferase involved in cell wall biosynthesis
MQALRHVMTISARRAAHLVVQTKTMAELVANELGLDLGRIHIVPPGLPGDIFASATRQPETQPLRDLRLLYVGNFEPYKNLIVLERALDEMRRAGHKAVLAATVERTHRLGMRADVEALGMISRCQLISEYRRAFCLVMPSLSETVGLPLLEAMALRVPIVAADRPYAKDVCSTAAVYFDPLKASSLCEALHLIRTDECLRHGLAESGFQRVRRFCAPDAYSRLLDVILN